MAFMLEQRRASYVDIDQQLKTSKLSIPDGDIKSFELFDLVYRSLCALLFNYVPTSGHPGGRYPPGVSYPASFSMK